MAPRERALALLGELLAAALGVETALRLLPGPWPGGFVALALLLWSGARAARLPARARGELDPWLRAGQERDALLLLAAALAALAGRPDPWAIAGFAALLLGHLAALPGGRNLALLAAGVAAGAALAVAGAVAIPALREAVARILLGVFLVLGWLLGAVAARVAGLLGALALGSGGLHSPPPPPELLLQGARHPRPGWLEAVTGGLAVVLVAAGVLLLLALAAGLVTRRLRDLGAPAAGETATGVRLLRTPLEKEAAPSPAPPRPAPTRLRRAYQRLERAFRAAGLGRPAGETPLQFAARPLPLDPAGREELARLTRLYAAHRYGDEPDPPASRLAGVEPLLRQVRRLGARRRG
ncbi:MAG: DUF4129 domain-containing protein [Bacillota bacterium]|nr:DUF4129 domain-containing protein [Bacillota bacterium]